MKGHELPSVETWQECRAAGVASGDVASASQSGDCICAGCGRGFKGHQRFCPGCRNTARACAECGQEFIGRYRLCNSCGPDRVCGCGQQFRGRHLQCRSCRADNRACDSCGETFLGETRLCPVCRSTERACAQCGRAFKGDKSRCPGCRATARTCADCGRAFKGDRPQCRACRGTVRECAGCGKAFTGRERRCKACQRAAMPANVRADQFRRTNNVRRARKAAAQVAGPVSIEVYSAIRKSGPCVYCGKKAAAIDHVRPLSRGGAEHESNLVPACGYCNSSKRDKLLTEWRPGRVARAVTCSPIVAAEWRRLTELAAAAVATVA